LLKTVKCFPFLSTVLCFPQANSDAEPLTIPFDHVFKPPSGLAKVLTSPNTSKIQKANVVFAVDADDKEKSFDYSKKV